MKNETVEQFKARGGTVKVITKEVLSEDRPKVKYGYTSIKSKGKSHYCVKSGKWV